MAKHLPEFPSDWHQQAHLEALERELLGYLRRQDELRSMGLAETDKAFLEAKSGEEAATAELKRIGGKGQKSASKRPAAEKRETR